MRITVFMLTFLLLLTVFPSKLKAGYVNQSDWSGGPGISGPVTSWSDTFHSEYHTAYISIPPGKLCMGIGDIPHIINSEMNGCYYAFPADMDGDGDIDVITSETLTSTPSGIAMGNFPIRDICLSPV